MQDGLAKKVLQVAPKCSTGGLLMNINPHDVGSHFLFLHVGPDLSDPKLNHAQADVHDTPDFPT